MAHLSKKVATCMIADYTLRLRKIILKKWWDVHGDDTEIEQPAAAIVAFFMCDGQPAAQLSKIVAADNHKFYMNCKKSHAPNLFPEDDGSDLDEVFEGWLKKDSKVGFFGRGKGMNTGSVFKGKFIAFPGGFHAGMKLHNCRGMMFGNIVRTF